MIRFAADEDFNHDIVRALRRSLPEVDIATVQHAEGSGWPDSRVLEWAAASGRVLLTHDVNTMTRHAIERIQRGEPTPGVIVAHQRLSIGAVLDDLVLVATYSDPSDWLDQIRFLPLSGN
jgi:hypothetical protein